MSLSKTNDKSHKFELVAGAVFTLLNQSGITSVSHSKVARIAGVSRPWIYKYIGKGSNDLIDFAAMHFGQKLLELGKNMQNIKKADELTHFAMDATWALMKKLNEHPEIAPLYFRYAGTKNPMGVAIQKLEKSQIKQMSQTVSQSFKISLTEAEIVAEVIMALRMGLGFRLSALGLGKKTDMQSLQKAIRRVFEHSTKLLKSSGR